MELNSTAKIVSLHMERCYTGCPNETVCYHKRKDISSDKTEEILPPNFRQEMLKAGYKLYESVCSVHIIDWTLLVLYKNYNLTLPYPLFEFWRSDLVDFKKQLQISVYTKEQARKILDYQKLFLIKDDASLKYAIEEQLWNIPYSYMHFNIDQNYITKKTLQEILYHRMLSNTVGTTIDSCAENWIINDECPYEHKQYIDITFDGTLRTCPFSKTGVPLKSVYDGTYDSLFKFCKPEQCKYAEIFGEIDGTNKPTSI